MMTLDLSNLVVLFDGVKNNHECEIVSKDNHRVSKVQAIDSRYAYPLIRSSFLVNGKYIFDERKNSALWVVISARNEVGKVIQGVEQFIIVSTIEVIGDATFERVKEVMTEYFGKQDSMLTVRVVEMFSQVQLAKRARSFGKSTGWELICLQLHRMKKAMRASRKSRD